MLLKKSAIEELYSHFNLISQNINTSKRQYQKNIIALTGPAGTSKTKSIELLAKWFDTEIIHYSDIEEKLMNKHNKNSEFKPTDFQIFISTFETAYSQYYVKKSKVLILKHIPDISRTYIKRSLNEFWRRNRARFEGFKMKTVIMFLDLEIYTQNICDKLFPFWMLRNIKTIETKGVGIRKLSRLWNSIEKNRNLFRQKKDYFGISKFLELAPTEKRKEITNILKKSCFGDVRVFLNQIYFEGIKLLGKSGTSVK